MTNKNSLLRAFVLLAIGSGVPLSYAADPADPAAAVPPARYQSAIAFKPPQPAPASPADTWKANNELVGAIDSMSLTMDGMAAPEQAPVAAKPTPPDPHAHHKMEHK